LTGLAVVALLAPAVGVAMSTFPTVAIVPMLALKRPSATGVTALSESGSRG
jgi:hypothetical protein